MSLQSDVNEATARASGRREAKSTYLPTHMFVSKVGGMAGRPGRFGGLGSDVLVVVGGVAVDCCGVGAAVDCCGVGAGGGCGGGVG